MVTKRVPMPTNPLHKSAQDSKRALVIALIAALIAIAAVVWSSVSWQQLRMELDAYAKLEKSFFQHKIDIIADIKALKNQIQGQQQLIANQQTEISKLNKLSSSTNKERALGEISYMLHLANLQLQIGQNINNSIRLVALADKRVQALNDSSLLMLKHTLAQDLAKLKAIPQVNVTNVITQLDALSQKTNALPLLPQKLALQTKKIDTISQDAPWYKKMWHELAGLKNLVTIRQIQNPVAPLLPPEQQVFLKENIMQKISQAQWAVLQHNNKLYQNSLTMIHDWIATNFHDQEQATQALNQISQLQKINVAPALPNLKASLTAINDAMDATQADPTPLTQHRSKIQVDKTQQQLKLPPLIQAWRFK